MFNIKKKLNNLPIARKFLFGFGIIFGLIFLFMSYTFYVFSVVNKSTDDEIYFQKIVTLTTELRLIVLRNAVLISQYTDVYDESLVSEVKKNRAIAADSVVNLRKLTQNPQLILNLNAYQALVSRRYTLADQIISSINQHAAAEKITPLRQERATLDNETRSYLKYISEIANSELRKAIKNSENLRETLAMNIALMIAFVLIALIFVSYWITASITKPIKIISTIVEKIAQGNLDVKAIIETDEELGRLARLLNDMTRKLKIEMAERKQAEADLKAVNSELDNFAYAASHDLKAPLRVIDNASKWIEEDLQEHLTPETRENMALLRGRVNRMEKLLDDLLEYSRIGRVQDERFSEIISGNDLMMNILELLLPPKTLTVTVDPYFSKILVHIMPLQQILMNLISNAIKHHDKQQGHIDVSVKEDEKYYTFSVKDDGPGIAAEFHEKIFNMFQTLKPRDIVEGSGMGLSLVKKNIEIFGGAIHLQSAEGKGSTFSFTWLKKYNKKFFGDVND